MRLARAEDRILVPLIEHPPTLSVNPAAAVDVRVHLPNTESGLIRAYIPI